MTRQEKLIARAEIIAAGIIRYHKVHIFNSSEMARVLEILAEDLARIEDEQEALKIRDRVERFGLHLPEIKTSGDCAAAVDPDTSDMTRPPVHAEQRLHEEPGQNTELSGSEPLRMSTKKDGTVHMAAPRDAQRQQNTGTSHLGGYDKGFTSVYNQRTESAAVHSDRTSLSKAQAKPELTRSAQLGRGLTLAYSQKSSGAEAEAPGDSYKPPNSRGATGSWTWRMWNYNRVPPPIEAAVFEKFQQGWSKSKLAREFRLNRRTVIRICRTYSEREGS